MGTPGRDLPVRRIRFGYPQGSLRKHYVDGDLVMSHVVAVLSATFPPGEDFFVRSVRHFSDQVSDPELKQQVRGFIGQEVTHGREHRELNKRLAGDGLPHAPGLALRQGGARRRDRARRRRVCACPTRPRSSTTPPPWPSAC